MLKSLLKIAAIVVAVLLVFAAAGLAVVSNWPGALRSTLEWALAPQGGEAIIESIDFRPGSQTLSMRNLRIVGPDPKLLNVEAGHLLVRADMLRAIGGGPPLRELEADGLKVACSLEHGKGGGGLDPTLLAHLLAMDKLRIQAKAIRINRPQTTLLLNGLLLNMNGRGKPDFDLVVTVNVLGGDNEKWFQGDLRGKGAGRVDGTLAGDLGLEQAKLDTSWLSGAVQANLRFELQGDRLDLGDISLDLPDSTVHAPAGGETLSWQGLKANLSASGQYDLAKGNMSLNLKRLAIEKVLDLSGQFGPQGLSAKGNLNCGQFLLGGIAPLLPPALQGLASRGGLDFDFQRRANGQNELHIVPKGLHFNLRDELIDIELGGALLLAGSDSALQWSGALLADAFGKAGDLSYRQVHLKLPLAGPLGRPGSPRPELLATSDAFSWQGRPLPLGRVSATGELVWHQGLPMLENLNIKAEALGGLSGSVGLAPAGPAADLAGMKIPAEAVLALAQTIAPGPLDGWQAGGGIDLALDLKPKTGGPKLSATLNPRALGLQSADGMLMVAELKGAINADVLISPKPRFTGHVSLQAGQLLYDTLYLDLTQRPINIKLAGIRQASAIWRDLLLDLRLGGMGSLGLTGSLDTHTGSPAYSGHLQVSGFKIGPAFAGLARPSLSARQPEFAMMEMGGQVGLGLDFRGQGTKAMISGRLAVSSGWLSPDGQTKTIDGLDLGLPFRYELGGKGGQNGKPKQWGRLRVAKLDAGGVSLDKLNLALALVPNRLIVDGELSLPLYGSTLRLSRMRVDQPLSSDYQVKLDAILSELNLAALPADGMQLQGSLAGGLGPVKLTARGLSCDGSLNGDFFGGKLRVNNIVARELFSGVPVFGADANANNVDLKSFTTALGAGVVSGRVKIDLKGLRVASGQPQAFALRLLSQETDGVDQEVSLQAVNSISVIGTGEGLTSFGMGLIQPLFERFSYEAIGFSCTLKNDVFTVRGLIRQGDVEYIVRKPPFFGINVINANKDNQISFSDMLERIRRVAAERAGSPEDQG